jgi:hypothetical protein
MAQEGIRNQRQDELTTYRASRSLIKVAEQKKGLHGGVGVIPRRIGVISGGNKVSQKARIEKTCLKR